MSDVYVVGIDMIRFGRYPDKTVVQLAAEAALSALDDCGLSMRDESIGDPLHREGERLVTDNG